jgi:hypothetical protein
MTTVSTTEERGASLSRGPALVLGTVLLAAGLYFLYKQHTFVKFSSFPSGTAKPTGTVFLGIFGVNGWTGELTAAAGGLLLFGAAHHIVAKTMSLIVGVVLAVVAVWALVNHHSALGLFGLGTWTIVGYGACAVLLLFNTAIPRRRTVTTVEEPAVDRSRAAAAAPPATAPAAVDRERVRATDTVPADDDAQTVRATRAVPANDGTVDGGDRVRTSSDAPARTQDPVSSTREVPARFEE